MRVIAVSLLAIGILGALARPRGLPAWVVPLGAAVGALATGVVSFDQVDDALRPLVAPLAFIAIAVPLAASLDHLGVFHELAMIAARRRHVVGACWVLAALVVALLNLDAAVVLLTPIYIRTALLADMDPVALAFQPVLLASLASSALVVSNLTNLTAASQLSLSNGAFLRHLALPTVAACAAGWVAYRVLFRPKAQTTIVEYTPDRRVLATGLAAIVMFVALLGVISPWQAALVVEAGLIAVTRSVPWRSVPAGTVVLAAALGVLAFGVSKAFPSAFSALGAGGFEGFGSGVAAANILNNLPAVLVGLPHASTATVWPLLLGVNLGPTLVLTGSLAGLLWQASARRAGVEIGAAAYSRVGVLVGVPAMAAAAAVLLTVK